MLNNNLQKLGKLIRLMRSSSASMVGRLHNVEGLKDFNFPVTSIESCDQKIINILWLFF